MPTLRLPSLRPDKGLARDVSTAISITLAQSRPRLVTAWIQVPFGTAMIMLVLWGIDAVIRHIGIVFPASVAAMLLLFLGLVAFDAAVGGRKVKAAVATVNVPASFALRYINLFFVPSFVLLPLSPSIGAAEVGKIVAVFFLGFVLSTAATVYIVRGLQLILPTPKRAHADDGGNVGESIPLTQPSLTPTPATSTMSLLPPPPPTLETQRLRGVGPVCTHLPERILTGNHNTTFRTTPPPPASPRLTRSQRLEAVLTTHLDTITYTLLFLFSLPVLYTTGYAMPSHLTLTILSFFTAVSIPARYQRLLHPVLSCAALTILGVYILSATANTPFKAALREYKTQVNYLALFRGTAAPRPGAADIFSSLLEVSIVALALPMYSHRANLFSHLPFILIPSLLLAAGSLTLYPLICSSIGIAKERAIAFSARSVTLALATPAVEGLGGDTRFLAVLCITSGVLGVLVGPGVLRVLKVREEEFVVRGVVLGGNGSAVSTAWLLGRGEVRAAAMGSLAMVAFGVVVVLAGSLGVVREGVGRLVGGA